MQKLWFGLAVVALIVAAWMGRYEIVGSGQFGAVRLDRFTGLVAICAVSYPCKEPVSPG
jgi:hypothetical protein